MDDVDPVGEQIGHLAAAEIEVGPPVVDTAAGRSRATARGRGNAPNPGSDGFVCKDSRRLAQVVAVAVPPGAGQRDLPQLPVSMYSFLASQVVLAASAAACRPGRCAR